MARWYHTSVINKQKFGNNIYAKASNDDKVIIFNGRFIIQTITKEEAKQNFKLLQPVEQRLQDTLDKDYVFYLHY